MSESKNKADTEVLQEIERLREENSQLMDDMMVYTGLAGHLHRLDVKIKHLKSLLIRAADALEKGPSDTDIPLVEELRKAAE